MDIHKPKPFHNLREFLSEIAIVVIGVSIALGAEQAIEALHWHHKIGAVEEAMHWELAEDDLPQAYARGLIGTCLASRLDALQALARPGTDGAAFARAAAAYAPPFRSWDSNAHAMLTQSDAGDHMAAQRVQAWDQPYTLMPRLNDFAEREADHVAIVHRTRYALGRLSDTDAREINDAIDALRREGTIMLNGSRIITGDGEALGIRVSDAERENLWRDAAGKYGACVPDRPPTSAELARLDGAADDQPTVRPGQF